MEQARILVVDDEPMVRDVVSRYLAREGYRSEVASTGSEAKAKLKSDRYDLVLLDIMLPERTGIELLADIRKGSDLPVIFLTARADEPDRVLGLELGADDYVTKPFSPRELVARVRTVLRRANGPSRRDLIVAGRIEIDPSAREVQVGGAQVELTAKEFDLLYFLASAPRQVFSRAQLLEHVWDSSVHWQDPSTVTVHVRRIRHKIEPDPASPQHLVTVRGVGYRFEP